MTKLIAIHKLGVSAPGATLTFTGQYDDNGEPILKKVTASIEPGEPWECDDPAEVRYLLDQGAVRLAEGERFFG